VGERGSIADPLTVKKKHQKSPLELTASKIHQKKAKKNQTGDHEGGGESTKNGGKGGCFFPVVEICGRRVKAGQETGPVHLGEHVKKPNNRSGGLETGRGGRVLGSGGTDRKSGTNWYWDKVTIKEKLVAAVVRRKKKGGVI